MSSLQKLILFGLILMMTPAFLVGMHNSRVTEYAQTAPNITTGGAETTTTVTLVKPLFDNDLVSVGSIVSSLSDALENPAVSSYVAATKVLTIQGLKVSDTRTLTITYEYGNLDDNSDTFMEYLPQIYIAAGLVLAAVTVWLGVKGSR